MDSPNSTYFSGRGLHNVSQLYGKGNFTTVAVVKGHPWLWEKHWRRLLKDAEKIGIDLSGQTEETTLDGLHTVIGRSTLEVGRARITFSDERASNIWPSGDGLVRQTSLSIILGERRSVPDEFRLTVSPFPFNSRSPLAGVKSCNYLENLMTLDQAKERGFHETVRVNERGMVTSAAMANMFWLRGSELFTPSLATGCLAGTTREFVLENVDCREVEVGIEELDSAEAIYLTSAGLGIVPVSEYNGREMRTPDHQITQLLTNH